MNDSAVYLYVYSKLNEGLQFIPSLAYLRQL